MSTSVDAAVSQAARALVARAWVGLTPEQRAARTAPGRAAALKAKAARRAEREQQRNQAGES